MEEAYARQETMSVGDQRICVLQEGKRRKRVRSSSRECGGNKGGEGNEDWKVSRERKKDGWMEGM